MARYTAKERQRILLRAKRAIGECQKQSASDKRIFLRQCIDQLTIEGESEDDARDICTELWESGEDLSEFD